MSGETSGRRGALAVSGLNMKLASRKRIPPMIGVLSMRPRPDTDPRQTTRASATIASALSE
ncbi:hypothetical protein CA830_05565 [Burkholderia multivorans]|nr:hypothetical protein CA831_22290 [Burkholderia multivorans]OXH93772.1 hypothetical protein CA830_05565 [Burkholderia multivorans]